MGEWTVNKTHQTKLTLHIKDGKVRCVQWRLNFVKFGNPFPNFFLLLEVLFGSECVILQQLESSPSSPLVTLTFWQINTKQDSSWLEIHLQPKKRFSRIKIHNSIQQIRQTALLFVKLISWNYTSEVGKNQLFNYK